MHLPEGYLLHHRYRIEKLIGQGGFGKTYKVHDQDLNHTYCVKELFISGSSTRGTNHTVQSEELGGISFADFKSKFLREAQELARFNHQGIVQVLNVFESNNTAYYVMEFLDGVTLKERVENTGPLERKLSIEVMQQLLDAVETVHDAGKLHRDIKPDNVLMTHSGRLVLIDFGSVREFSDGKTLTQTALITPGYAPLEQYSERATRTMASDIYALGATLYFLLTGKKPLPAIDRLQDELSAPHEINPNVDSQISSAVMLAMQMRSEDRFQTVSELRTALQTLSGKSSVVSPKSPTPALERENKPKSGLSVSPIHSTDDASVNKELNLTHEKQSKKNNRGSIIITILVVVLLGIVLFEVEGYKDSLNSTRNQKEDQHLEDSEEFDEGHTEDNQAGYDEGFQQDDLNQTEQIESSDDVLSDHAEDDIEEVIAEDKTPIDFDLTKWAKMNLNVDHFRNGDPIPHAKTDFEWIKAGENGHPAWCYYDQDLSNGEKFGRLYNWYAVHDPRGLAPAGWHIPSDQEWTKLVNHLGGPDVAGAKMKSSAGWKHSGNDTNESVFTGLLGGHRSSTGTFYFGDGEAFWWSSTELDKNSAWIRNVYNRLDKVFRFSNGKEEGLSVRCVQN